MTYSPGASHNVLSTEGERAGIFLLLCCSNQADHASHHEPSVVGVLRAHSSGLVHPLSLDVWLS